MCRVSGKDDPEVRGCGSEAKATYAEIRAYVKEKYGMNVSSLYIAQVKRKYGLDEGKAYNKLYAEMTDIEKRVYAVVY